MSTMTISELYEWHIKPLSFFKRLRLVEFIMRRTLQDDHPNDVATRLPSETSLEPQHDIMELHGLGAEIWQGIDAQDYVNQLREEWDR